MVLPVFSMAVNLSGSTWTDLIDRALKWDTKQGRQYELATPEAGEMGVDWYNRDEYLSVVNTGSPYAGQLLPYKPVRVVAAWNAATLDATGNVLNDGNSGWLDAPVSATDGGFETGVGHWAGTGSATIAPSTAQHQAGTQSLAVTFPTASGGAGATLTIPTVPGRATTVTGYVYLPASGGPTGVGIGTGYGAGTTTGATGAWTRLSATFTPTGYTTTLTFTSTAATTSGQVAYVDSVQVELAAAATAYSSTGPTLYALFDGFVERWPETWDPSGFRADVNSISVDAYATIGVNQYGANALALDLLKDAPVAYWPLGDAAGSATFADQSGNSQPSLVKVTSTTPTAGASVTAGTTYPIGGDDYLAAAFNAGTAYAQYNGYALAAGAAQGFFTGTADPLPSGTADYAVVVVATPTARNAGLNDMTVVQLLESATSANVTVGIDSAGKPYLQVHPWLTAATRVTATVAASTTTPTGLTVNYTGGVWSLYTGTTLVGTINVTPAPNFDVISVGGGVNGIDMGAFDGTIAHVAVYDAALPSARITSHAAGVASCYAGDLTSTRFARLLGWAGYAGGVNAPAGTYGVQTTMQAATALTGKTVSQVLVDVANTENGQLLVDGYGRFTLLPRSYRYTTTTAAWTLGEDETGGEIAYEGDVSPTIDPQIIYNDVTVTRQGGIVAHAVNAASKAAYFLKTLARTVYNESDSETTDAANWIASRYGQPQVRLNRVTVDAVAAPQRMAFVLGVKQGDRVTVKRRLSTGVTWSGDFFVELVERRVDPGATCSASVQLSPAFYSTGWILDDPVNSVLDSTTILVY